MTDIVISHSHWDHTDGAELFPRAMIWIQKEEYEYYIGSQGEVLHTGGVDADDARMLAEMKKAGRVRLVDGDAQEILPGITVYTGGKHTYAAQFAGVRTNAGTVVLASDNAYLYENLEKHLPIAQTLDAASNLKAQERMLALAASPALVIPGHDPAVFDRFPAAAGVARIAVDDRNRTPPDAPREHRWFSSRLQRDMPRDVRSPVPSRSSFHVDGVCSDFDRGMVVAVARTKIGAGLLRLACVSTVDRESLRRTSRRARLERYLVYEQYCCELAVCRVVRA